MLVEFSVSNFLSFNEEVIFSTVAGNVSEFSDRNVISINKEGLLKNSCIFGANNSGKSNFAKAVKFFKGFVMNSYEQSLSNKINFPQFKLLSDNRSNTRMQITFLNRKAIYRYGFELTNEEIKSEWLYRKSLKSGSKEALLFERKEKVKIGTALRSWKVKPTPVKKNVLLLTKLSLDFQVIQDEVFSWFDKLKIISGVDNSYGGYTRDKVEKSQKFKSKIIQYLKDADIQIQDLSIESKLVSVDQTPKELQNLLREKGLSSLEQVNVNFKHKVFNSKRKFVGYLDLNLENEESEGTNHLFNLLGPIIDVLENGYTLIVDEIDTNLHPKLVEFLVGLFNSSANNSAQLICTTHTATLLNADILRRDQIWFLELNRFGSSKLYSLNEIKFEEKKVRKDENYFLNYIFGKYGGIPLVSIADEEIL